MCIISQLRAEPVSFPTPRRTRLRGPDAEMQRERGRGKAPRHFAQGRSCNFHRDSRGRRAPFAFPATTWDHAGGGGVAQGRDGGQLPDLNIEIGPHKSRLKKTQPALRCSDARQFRRSPSAGPPGTMQAVFVYNYVRQEVL